MSGIELTEIRIAVARHEEQIKAHERRLDDQQDATKRVEEKVDGLMTRLNQIMAGGLVSVLLILLGLAIK